MVESSEKKSDGTQSLARPSYSELVGRQSVRATFKLTEKAIAAVGIVATHLGIKQKSLFDHLIGDIPSLNLIARDIRQDEFQGLPRIQKTYVLSRRTLWCLEETAKEHGASRDALVEYSVKRLLPVIDEEKEKHQKRKKILLEIQHYLERGEKLFAKAEEQLGLEDPVCQQLHNAVSASQTACDCIKTFVEKGSSIESFT